MSHRPPDRLELYLFTVDERLARRAEEAGVEGLVVDWEHRGKERRQAGADTEVNRDAPADLARLSLLHPGIRRLCRINGPGPTVEREVDVAVAHGATDVLLPMVRSAPEVEAFLRHLDARARPAVLVETLDAVSTAEEIARLPVARVYLGLNDLAIERHDRCLFTPLVDGTAERLRQTFCDTAFGLAGLTDLDRGHPIPCRHLLAEMARLGCDFTFLRRSFKRDVGEDECASAIARLRAGWAQLRRRPPDRVRSDHTRFVATVRTWNAAGCGSAG